MRPNLFGRTALVTGASGDIGSAVSRELAKAGAHIALHYRSSAASVERLAAEPVFRDAGCTICFADLSSERETAALFEHLHSIKGPIDTLICNAGQLTEQSIPVQDMPLEQWRYTIDQNLTATFLTLRGFLRGVRQHRIEDPAIVIIGSMAGIWGQPGHADYAAAKAAMVSGMLPTLKDEIVRLAPHGRVNLIAPGFVKTRMITEKLKNVIEMKQVLQTASLRKFATPEDVAHLAAFLASNKLSGHITGAAIRLAGGKEGRILFDPSEINI